MRGGLVVVIALLACGPAVDGGGAATTSSDTRDSTDSSSISAVTSATSSSGDTAPAESSESTPAGSTTEGDLLDPCLSGTPPDCAPECTTVTAYRRQTNACDVGEPRAFCVSIGEPIADSYRSTWYAQIDGELWFALAGQFCVEWVPASPLTWTECSGSADDPELCGCLCARGECGWDAEADLLQSCGYPSPCPEAEDTLAGEYSDAQICMLTALRDRQPAELIISDEGEGREQRVYIEGNGDDAQALRWFFPGVCGTPLAAAWRPNERCQLAPPEYFDACLNAAGPGDQDGCLDTFDWLTACEDTPAACP